MTTYLNFTLRCSLWISLTIFLPSCALFETSPKAQIVEDIPTENGSAFSKAQALVLAHDYENALPFIKRSLEADNTNYADSLLLASRAYDQLSQPEQAILALREYLKQKPPLKLLTARSLLFKNLFKIKQKKDRSLERKAVQKLAQTLTTTQVLIDLAWSLDFRCDQYCNDEVAFWEEMQLNLLYIVEKDNESSDAASKIIISRYEFFSDFKQVIPQLQKSLKKLKNLVLVSTEKNRRYPAKSLLISLNAVEEKLK